MKKTTYIVPDPQHEYAISLIEHVSKTYGLKPICVYLDSKAELYKRPFFPQLRGDLVEGHYFLDQTPAAALAATLQEKYEILGVMPYFEQALDPMADLVGHLGIAWNSPDVLHLFRNKSGLKQHLRTHAPSVPMNYSRHVTGFADVMRDHVPAHFVIKPNDGFANRDIGFFDARDGADVQAAVAAYFQGNTGGSFILEEFLDGVEYAVNGQVDEKGDVIIVNVTEYERAPGNGKPNLYHRTIHVPQTDPAFAPLATYAQDVMRASGLLRCPFHMELMLTPEGPRLIEVGARFGGTRYAYIANWVHGGAFDIFALAAHFYLFNRPYDGTGPDWQHYDSVSFVHFDGMVEKTQRVYTLAGFEQVEAMPEFRGWVRRPRVGDMVQRTLDLYSIPYSFHLMSRSSRAELVALSERASATIAINPHPSRPRRLWVDALSTFRSVTLRARWLATQLCAKRA